MINRIIKKIYHNARHREPYYASLLTKYYDLNSYKGIFSGTAQKKGIFTNQSIIYTRKNLKLGDDIKNIQKNVLGKPNFHFKNKTVKDTNILLYKFLNGNQKILFIKIFGIYFCCFVCEFF